MKPTRIDTRTDYPHECGGCDRKVAIVVRVGERPDYETQTAYLCRDCLLEALALAPDPVEVVQPNMDAILEVIPPVIGIVRNLSAKVSTERPAFGPRDWRPIVEWVVPMKKEKP